MPSVARGLATAIGKLPPQMRSYKNLLPIRDALLAYLARIGDREDSMAGEEGR